MWNNRDATSFVVKQKILNNNMLDSYTHLSTFDTSDSEYFSELFYLSILKRLTALVFLEPDIKGGRQKI